MIGVVQWSDLHAPHVEWSAIRAILYFAKAYRPDYHIIIGDALNLSGISRHVQEDYMEQYENKVEDGLKVLGQIIDAITKINPDSKIVWIWGNHDERLRAFVRKNPSWQGIIDNPLKLLRSFGDCENTHRIRLVQYTDPEEDFRIGPMSYTHGYYTGKHCAAQHADAYGTSVTVGHTHTMQMFCSVRKGEPVAAFTIGNLMSKEGRRYLKGRPHRWVVGFAYLEYDEKSGIYTQHLLPVIHGRFCFAGRVYDGSENGAANPKGRRVGRRSASVQRRSK